MHDEIMDDIKNKALEDAHRMIFKGGQRAVQAMKVHNSHNVNLGGPIPPGVVLQDPLRGFSVKEVVASLDGYLSVFEKIELMALTEAIREVISSNSNQNMLYCLEELLAANDGDRELPDDVELWQAYDNSELQDVVDTIDTIHQNRRGEYAKVISLVTGIDFEAN